MDRPIEFKSGDTKTDLRYIFMFSASKIKVCSHNFIIQLLCVYKYINPCIHLRKICYVYILYIYICNTPSRVRTVQTRI